MNYYIYLFKWVRFPMSIKSHVNYVYCSQNSKSSNTCYNEKGPYLKMYFRGLETKYNFQKS